MGNLCPSSRSAEVCHDQWSSPQVQSTRTLINLTALYTVSNSLLQRSRDESMGSDRPWSYVHCQNDGKGHVTIHSLGVASQALIGVQLDQEPLEASCDGTLPSKAFQVETFRNCDWRF